VPLVAAAVCPHPPVIVPQLAAGAAAELDDLRAACAEAIARLRAAGADALVVVGGATDTRPIAPPFRASFAPWGLALELGRAGETPEGELLPLSLAVGWWLLNRSAPGADSGTAAAFQAPVLQTVSADAPAAECRALGERLAGTAERVALLVMGDGSAERRETPTGHEDPRARPYDSAVAKALAAADAEALLALDPALSTELRAAGRAAWQVLAGAALASGPSWRGELLYDAAPYGVTYFVASWRPA